MIREKRLLLAIPLLVVLASCAAPKASYETYRPGQAFRYREVGQASWYGEEYHGRRTSNGEVYDMNAMTAAHRTLPFNTRVLVTNLENGKKAEVRINDRGPFVGGRIIDLSRSGAIAIAMMAKGTARVSLEAVGFAGGQAPPLEGLFAIQVGAFGERENALRMRDQLEKRHPKVHIVPWESNTQRFYRVRVGAFRTEAQARTYLESLRKEGLPGLVLRED